MSNQQIDELRERTFEVLCKVAPELDNDDLSLLCYHCGFSIKDIPHGWFCPYCGDLLADNQTPCCGEIGHGELR